MKKELSDQEVEIQIKSQIEKKIDKHLLLMYKTVHGPDIPEFFEERVLTNLIWCKNQLAMELVMKDVLIDRKNNQLRKLIELIDLINLEDKICGHCDLNCKNCSTYQLICIKREIKKRLDRIEENENS